MDHDRHLISDDGFDVFERASYGRGCEIVPHEHNHQNPKCMKFYDLSFKFNF